MRQTFKSITNGFEVTQSGLNVGGQYVKRMNQNLKINWFIKRMNQLSSVYHWHPFPSLIYSWILKTIRMWWDLSLCFAIILGIGRRHWRALLHAISARYFSPNQCLLFCFLNLTWASSHLLYLVRVNLGNYHSNQWRSNYLIGEQNCNLDKITKESIFFWY